MRRGFPMGDPGSERGQILVIVATAFLFVMMVAGALAIDLGNGWVQKRRLQNAADAAALAAAQIIASGGYESDAIVQAQSLVTYNTGGLVSLRWPGIGSGTGLSDGIEISGGDVRVALSRQVPTYFAAIMGIGSMAVGVRSRAMVGPAGSLPIATKRFSGGDTSMSIGSGGNPSSVKDYLRPANADDISAWPSPITSPAPVAAAYTSPDAYNPGVSGRVFPILGQDAQPSVAHGNNFRGFIALDVRGITYPVMSYYNGVTASHSIQSLKDIESAYFTSGGYPGPNPVVGDQIGVLNGAANSQTVDALRKAYRRGDIVTAMVYNGTVYRKPSYDLSIDATVKDSANIGPGGSPISFQVTLVPNNNFTSSGVQFSATGLESWADWQFNSGALNTTYSAAVGGGNLTATFSVSATSVVQGIRTVLIRAYDPNSGNLRTICATVIVGSSPAYSLVTLESYQVVEQSSAATFDLNLRGWNGYPTTTVTIGTPEWYTDGVPPVAVPGPNGMTVSVPASVQVRDNHTSSVQVTLAVASTADVGQWLLKIPTSDGSADGNRQIYLTVLAIPAGSSTEGGNTSFVVVLGYVNMVITYANNASTPQGGTDNNSIYAYVVSPLAASPTSLGRGLGARLVSWSQSL